MSDHDNPTADGSEAVTDNRTTAQTDGAPVGHIPLDAIKDDESVLALAQQQRLHVLNQLRSQSDDPKAARVVLAALDGMEKQVLTQRKLDIEEDSSKSQGDMAKSIAAISESISRQHKNPFRARSNESKEVADPKSQNRASEFNIPEHERNQSATHTDVESFMSKLDKA